MNEEEEKEELRRKEEGDTHSHIIIKVSRDEDFIGQIGRNIYFDLVDHEKVRSFRIPKHERFFLFKAKISQEFGVQIKFQRFWAWGMRKNGTHRPYRPLTSLEEDQSVGELREVSKWEKCSIPMLVLFLEVELGLNLRPVSLPEKTEEEILLFFKLYDPLKQELRYVGKLFAKKEGMPVEILSKLNKMAGFSHDEEIELFEEIEFEPHVTCNPIDMKITFHDNELQDGDIICFQKSHVGISEACPYPDVPSFLNYVHECKFHESTAADAENRSYAAFDTLFIDIEQLLEGQTSKAKDFSNFLPPPCSVEEVAEAKMFFKQCLNLNLASVIQLEKASELKNSLSIMLAANTFPDNMVLRTTKFLTDFDESCEKYESAKQDISEAQEYDTAVGELKATLKQLLSEFIPVRNEVEAIDREIAKLEKQMTERKAKKERLSKCLEDLAGRATTTKQALVGTEQRMKLSAVKKDQAEKTVGDLERSWESLKVDCSMFLE